MISSTTHQCINKEPVSSSSSTSSYEKCRILILDTAPLLQQVPLYHFAEQYITVPEVVKEVRDQVAREKLAQLPIQLTTLSPSPDAFQCIIEMAKKTGDYPQLSVTDLKVLALAYMLHQKHSSTDKNKQASLTKSQPPSISKQTTNSKNKKWVHLPGFVDIPEEKEVKENENQENKLNHSKVDTILTTNNVDNNKNDNDDDTWLSIENIEKLKQSKSGIVSIETEEETLPEVACMTSDYAMQNVLLQMKIHLLSIDGLRIKSLKNWLLRCHACFNTIMNMEKRFCPKCGNATLIRTSYSIINGKLKLHLKKNFQYKLRGTIYPTPKSIGNTPQVILREDQKEFQVQQKRYTCQLKKLEKKEWDDAIFGDTPLRPPEIGFGRRNPNVARRPRK